MMGCHPRTLGFEGDNPSTWLVIALADRDFAHWGFGLRIFRNRNSKNSILKFRFDGMFICVSGQRQNSLKRPERPFDPVIMLVLIFVLVSFFTSNRQRPIE